MKEKNAIPKELQELIENSYLPLGKANYYDGLTIANAKYHVLGLRVCDCFKDITKLDNYLLKFGYQFYETANRSHYTKGKTNIIFLFYENGFYINEYKIEYIKISICN